ncbi:unnamed protein product, partial [Heterosigma akashiwo]
MKSVQEKNVSFSSYSSSPPSSPYSNLSAQPTQPMTQKEGSSSTMKRSSTSFGDLFRCRDRRGDSNPIPEAPHFSCDRLSENAVSVCSLVGVKGKNEDRYAVLLPTDMADAAAGDQAAESGCKFFPGTQGDASCALDPQRLS